jgi:hypothetical protein
MPAFSVQKSVLPYAIHRKSLSNSQIMAESSDEAPLILRLTRKRTANDSALQQIVAACATDAESALKDVPIPKADVLVSPSKKIKKGTGVQVKHRIAYSLLDELDAYSDHGSAESSAYEIESDPSDGEEAADEWELVAEDEHGNVGDFTEEQLERQRAEFSAAFSSLNSVVVEGRSQARARKPVVMQCSVRVNTVHEKSDPTKITPEQRIKEYPGQGFTVHFGKLWCGPCSKELAKKKSTIDQHIGQTSGGKQVTNFDDIEHVKRLFEVAMGGEERRGHQTLLKGMTSKAAVEAEQLTGEKPEGFFLEHGSGNTTSEASKLYQMRVCDTLLENGLHFNFLNDPSNSMRKLLEEGRGKLPKNAVAQFIPILLEADHVTSYTEMEEAEEFSFTFDGKYHINELMNCVVRFVLKGKIQHRVIGFKMLKNHLDGRELARWLLDVLQLTRWRESRKKVQIRFCSRDGAAVNTAAIAHLQMILEPHGTFDVICFSHSTNVAGQLLVETNPLADRAGKAWSALLVSSAECRSKFRQQAGEKGQTQNSVRWYAWFDVEMQLMKFFSLIRTLADLEELGCEQLRANLRLAMDESTDALQRELALIKDASTALVSCCYLMEGDSFLAPIAFDCWEEMRRHGRRLTGRGPVPGTPISPFLEAEILKQCVTVIQFRFCRNIASNGSYPRNQKLYSHS